jgi:AcrR family transcriptional regulator
MTKRLTAQDWIDFALKTLAREGFDALKADVLARKIGVSRGSFYWHFTGLGTFHSQVIERWRDIATEAIIADIEQYGSHEERLDALLRHAFGGGATLEIRMRAWAGNNAVAARALSDVDLRRREYIRRLLMEAGVAEPLAATRAQLLYWAYLGAAFSGTKLTGGRLDQMVAELKQMGLGRLTGRPAAAGTRREKL